MVDRRVEVQLLLDISNFHRNANVASADARRISAALHSVDVDVSKFGKSGERAASQIGEMGRQTDLTGTQVDRLGTRVGRTGNQIDRLSGRIKLWSQAAAVFGPGLLPIGAVGVPALASMVSLLGAATLGAGSLVFAFQGVIDAGKAVNDYVTEPTAANLEKAQLAMQQLGPDARRFVMEFQAFRPVLDGFRDAAAAGWFPGLTDALDSIDEAAPRIESLLSAVSEAGGDIVADSVESLTGERWKPFLDFLETEAPTAMRSLSDIVGDLSHGFAGLMMLLDPGSDAGIAWIEDVADGFDRWSQSAEGREDVAAFLEYASENGPKVADFFGSLVNMFTQIAQAAAPLGGPVLDILTAVADTVAGIADSDLGTPIFAGLAALSIYNRTLAMTAKLQQSAFGQSAMGQKAGAGVAGFLGGQLTSSRSAIKALRSDLAVLGPQYAKTATMSERLGVASKSLSTNLKGVASGAARVGGPIAGLAVLSSGAADGLGLTNSASLALMGSFAGPWGAAVGGAAGAILDFKAASDDSADSIEAWKDSINAAISGGDFGALEGVLSSAREELSAFKDDVGETGDLGFGDIFDMDLHANNIAGLFGDSNVEKQEAALKSLEAQVVNTEGAYGALGETLGMNIGPIDGSVRSAEELTLVMERAKPAMDALGISAEQLATGFAAKQGGDVWSELKAGLDPDTYDFDTLTEKIREFQEGLATPEGALRGLGDALTGLGDVSLPAAEKAALVGQALDAYMDPANNAEAATHDLVGQLQAMRDTLNSDFGFGEFTEKGRENAQITRDYAEAVQAQLTTMVAAGASEKELRDAMRGSKRELIESGIAAGFSREQMEARARAIGLTPKLVQTVFKALHVSEFDRAVRNAKNVIKDIPADVVTDLRANGVPQTTAQVNRLLDRYDLTEKERRAVLRLVDLASDDLGAILQALGKTEKPRTAKVKLNPGNTLGLLGQIIAGLNQVHSKSITVTTTHRTVGSPYTGDGRSTQGGSTNARGGFHVNGLRQFAGGGWGDGGEYYPRMPMMVPGGANILWGEQETGWEAYISGKPGERDRNLQVLELAAERLGVGILDTHARRFANGGLGNIMHNGPLPPKRSDFYYGDGTRMVQTFQTGYDLLLMEIKARKKDLTERLKEAEKRKTAVSEELDSMRSFRDELVQASEALGDSLTGKLKSDLFADLGENSPATLQSVLDVAMKDRAQARAVQQALFDLKNLGLDEDALQTLIEEGSAQNILDFSKLSREEIDKLEQAILSRQDAIEGAGETAGFLVFGEKIDAATDAIHLLRAEQIEGNRLVKDLTKKVEQVSERETAATKQVGPDVANALNRKGAKAQRSRR